MTRIDASQPIALAAPMPDRIASVLAGALSAVVLESPKYTGGVAGTKAECLAHIEEVWTDMRPASLRRWMSERAGAD